MENNSAWFLEQMKPCTKKKKIGRMHTKRHLGKEKDNGVGGGR